jgi:hypothetical protein
MMLLIWQSYAFFPFLDFILPHDNTNPDPKLERALEKDKRFLIPLFTGALIDISITAYCLYLVSYDLSFSNNIFRFLMLAILNA